MHNDAGKGRVCSIISVCCCVNYVKGVEVVQATATTLLQLNVIKVNLDSMRLLLLNFLR